ncbi:PqiC family protein [Pseudomonas amygdali]|nr:PqiC family protein [Pseudomonas amygdali]
MAQLMMSNDPRPNQTANLRNVSAMRTIILLVSFGMGLLGCSSAPIHYYTLLGHIPDPPSPLLTPDYQFEMIWVRLPLIVDQPQIVLRQDQGRLEVLENDRWPMPLSEELQEALELLLEKNLGTRNLAGVYKDPLQPVLSIQVDVRLFETRPGSHVLIDAIWSIAYRSADQPRRTLTCASRLKQSVSMNLENAVLAHQRLIEELAGRIANKADAWVKDSTQKCSVY